MSVASVFIVTFIFSVFFLMWCWAMFHTLDRKDTSTKEGDKKKIIIKIEYVKKTDETLSESEESEKKELDSDS